MDRDQGLERLSEQRLWRTNTKRVERVKTKENDEETYRKWRKKWSIIFRRMP